MKIQIHCLLLIAILALSAGGAAAQGPAQRAEAPLPAGDPAAPASRAPCGEGPAWEPALVATEGLTRTVFLPAVARNMSAIPCFYDDFANPASGWYVGGGSGWSIGYLNGEYRISLTENDSWAWGSPDRTLSTNYGLEVDARLIGTNLGAYGLIFGADQQVETGYAFVVFPTLQAYTIVRQNADGSFTTLEDDDYNPVIHAGTATNRLRVDRIGSSIHAYVNGVLVAAWDDDSFMGAGLHFALAAYSYDEGAVDARFDNFVACPAFLPSPLFVEDFSVTGRWLEGDYGWGRFSYQSGEYEILIRNTDSWGYAGSPIEGNLPRYAVEVDARVSAGEVAIYGINFGEVDNNNFYHFRVYPAAQQYRLFKLAGGSWVGLTAWTVNSAIHDHTGVNHLRVERDGNQIRLYANGTLLTSLSDSSYTGNLGLSLFGMSWTEANVAVRFDNFVFSQLP